MYHSSTRNHSNKDSNKNQYELMYVALPSEPQEKLDFRAIASGYYYNFLAKRSLSRRLRTMRHLQTEL